MATCRGCLYLLGAFSFFAAVTCPSAEFLIADVKTLTPTSGKAQLSARSNILCREGQGFRWHPGHYVHVDIEAISTPMTIGLILARQPLLRGIKRGYRWNDMERSRDSYDFSAIDRDIRLMRAWGKQLVIQIEIKAFRPGESALPTYILQDPQYKDGIYVNVKGALNPAVWNPKMQDRVRVLYRALAMRFADELTVEAVVTAETAITADINSLTAKPPFTERLHAEAWLALAKEFRTYAPRLTIIQYTNVLGDALDWFVKELRNSGIGFGGPDVFIEDTWLSENVYKYYEKMSGEVPIGVGVEWEDYDHKRHLGPVDPPAIKDLYKLARDHLKANYIFWTLRGYRDPKERYFQNVIEFLDRAGRRHGATGGLSADCPKSMQ